MLDLNAPTRTVAGVDLAADSGDPRAFHVLPGPPRVAAGDAGPELVLLRFHGDDGALAGGHLQLTVEAGHPAERLEEARAALVAELGDETVELRPLIPAAATAELLFLGRETDADGGLGSLVRRGFGTAAATFDPPHRARFALDLDAAGVRLVEAALASGGAPVGVVYRLTVEGLWPATSVVARIDWQRVYDHFSVHRRRGSVLLVEDLKQITERLVEERAIEIHAVQSLEPAEGEAAPGLDVALAWIQREVMERFCEPVMELSRTPAKTSLGAVGEVFGAGSAFAVKATTQIERLTGEIDLGRSAVVARTLTVQAHLADLLGGAPLAGHVADAARDHPFFRRFALRVAATRPLPELHLAEAVLHFRYGTHASSARLDAGASEARFETWADASADGSWSLAPELRFDAGAPVAGGETVRRPALTGTSRELALDLEALAGLRRLKLVAPADPRVVATRVEVEHRRDGSRRAGHEVMLAAPAAGTGAGDAAASAAAEAELWLSDFLPGDRIEVKPAYLTADGQLLEGPSLVADTRVLRLPPPFPGTMTVQLVADDDWSELERVLVAIEKTAGGPSGAFVLTAPGELVPVALDLPDPADRSYRYRVTRTLAGGAVEEDPWVTADASVLVVGRIAADRLVVDVTPVGPELAAAGILLIEVELLYLDVDHRIRETGTLVLRARADRPRWSIAIADPSRRSYEYRVTVHRTDGTREAGPWTRASDRILPIPVTSR